MFTLVTKLRHFFIFYIYAAWIRLLPINDMCLGNNCNKKKMKIIPIAEANDNFYCYTIKPLVIKFTINR